MAGTKTRGGLSIQHEIKQSKPFATKSQEAYVALLRTADDSKRHVGDVLEPAGVTLQQYNVLRILRGAGDEGLPTLTVAERMIERTPGITRLLDRMERKGLVTRERSDEDKRQVLCRITADGTALIRKLDKPMDSMDQRIFGSLSTSEHRALLRALAKIRASVT